MEMVLWLSTYFNDIALLILVLVFSIKNWTEPNRTETGRLESVSVFFQNFSLVVFLDKNWTEPNRKWSPLVQAIFLVQYPFVSRIVDLGTKSSKDKSFLLFNCLWIFRSPPLWWGSWYAQRSLPCLYIVLVMVHEWTNYRSYFFLSKLEWVGMWE